MNEEAEQLIWRCLANIQQFQKIVDQVLPQAGKLVLDIGLVNDALIESESLTRQIPSVLRESGAE